MFDVFYLDKPTGLFPHERHAATLQQACEMSRTRYLWVLDSRNDYSGFDWTWEPVPWESHQTHVWPSQHQENGGTCLVPKTPGTEINRNHTVIPRRQPSDIVGIDLGNGIDIQCHVKTKYISDYLGTLRRVLAKVSNQHVWVVSSVCDYSNFDFTWHPSEWQQQMLHVFASGKQEFGDTFYIHVPSFFKRSENLALLEWFDTINFVADISVPRRPVPVCVHDNDSHVQAIRQYDFTSPVVQFSTSRAVDPVPEVNLWRAETKAIMPLTPGATSVLIPREVKTVLRNQLYDYPVIDRAHDRSMLDQPLDVVFISNGEYGADHHYQCLQLALVDQPNKLHHVQGVNGRVAAYQAAANISTSPWFFAVFAKLQVNTDFNWAWQPDRMQQPKHYIFHALNPVNHLIYGHQATIAYNQQLVLENIGPGLDFTLDQAHEVVPVMSGTAYYDNDPWTCWRTAFRECIKLQHSLPDVENQYRLDQWLSVGEGVNGHWSTQGAQDAVDYYQEVNGQFSALKKTYEWEWLASYALVLRPELFTASKT